MHPNINMHLWIRDFIETICQKHTEYGKGSKQRDTEKIHSADFFGIRFIAYWQNY